MHLLFLELSNIVVVPTIKQTPLTYPLQWTPLNMAIIPMTVYYPEILFSQKSKFCYKGVHISRLDILARLNE